MAYHMQDSYERQMEKEADYVAFDTAMAAFTETENMAKNRSMSIGSSSDLDSFVSATDVSPILAWRLIVIKRSSELCLKCQDFHWSI
jgi:hypothetical protein